MKCKNCEINDAIKYSKHSNGEFCTKTCARSFSTKLKRNEINEKVSEIIFNKGKGWVFKKCELCEKDFKVKHYKRKQRFCSKECCSHTDTLTDEGRLAISKTSKERNGDEAGRKRMRDIGRMGGFGKKGYTSCGTFYQSLLEKECFEFLEINNVEFIPHKNIPNSSKISDVYITNYDLWVEIDGIDRDKRSKWLESEYKFWVDKLEIYKREMLNYKVVKNYKEFKLLFNDIK